MGRKPQPIKPLAEDLEEVKTMTIKTRFKEEDVKENNEKKEKRGSRRHGSRKREEGDEELQ